MPPSKTYQVNEIFHSIQGEGFLAGRPTTFIRLQGCRVECEWCDTKYTWLKGGERMTLPQIMNRIRHRHVVVTGGEPTMYNLDLLLLALHQRQHITQLETSGQQWLKGRVQPHWITLSPKENLGYQILPEYQRYADEVKWVVDEALPYSTVKDAWNEWPENNQVKFILMPEGCPPRPEMVIKVLEWLGAQRFWDEIRWFYGDRLQYRIGVE